MKLYIKTRNNGQRNHICISRVFEFIDIREKCRYACVSWLALQILLQLCLSVCACVSLQVCVYICVCEHVLSNIQQRSAELPVKAERSKEPASGSKVTADLSPVSSQSSVTGRRDEIHKQAGKVCIYMQTSLCQCILPLTSGIHDLRPFQNNSAQNLCPFLTSPPTSLPPFPFKHLHTWCHYFRDLTPLPLVTFLSISLVSSRSVEFWQLSKAVIAQTSPRL